MTRSAKKQYGCDVTYGTNNEFGFDYLRDNMKYSVDEFVQREFNYAIVDEVDSILIDEARTPLIISGPAEESTDKYYKINKLIYQLKKEADFKIDEKAKSAYLTEEGVAKIEKLLKVDNLYDPKYVEFLHHVNQALKAHHLFTQGRRLHREGRPGHHRRRVHRQAHARQAVQRRPPPGPGGEGERQDRAGEPDPRHGHVPELFPHVQEARRHDGHGRYGGDGVQEDLQPGRRRHPHEPPS